MEFHVKNLEGSTSGEALTEAERMFPSHAVQRSEVSSGAQALEQQLTVCLSSRGWLVAGGEPWNLSGENNMEATLPAI